MTIVSRLYREREAGGFTRVDGTVQFFTRVNALINPSMTILEFGAGRGRISDLPPSYVRSLATLKGKAARVIGLDVDKAVLDNKVVDEALVFDGGHIPLPDASVDMVVSDHVFEHLPDPARTAAELHRVLKPGGWICARTPSSTSLMSVFSRLIPNRLHSRFIGVVQPGGRPAHDVFPTFYRLNSPRILKRFFPKASWRHFSYTWNPEPGYHFGSVVIFQIVRVIQYLKQPLGGEVLLIFMQKR